MLRKSIEKPKARDNHPIEPAGSRRGRKNQRGGRRGRGRNRGAISREEIHDKLNYNSSIKNARELHSNDIIEELSPGFEQDFNYEGSLNDDSTSKDLGILSPSHTNNHQVFISQKSNKNGLDEYQQVSDLDSPYQGDDKFDLDIDGKDTPLGETAIEIESQTSKKNESKKINTKNSFETLDKNFIFGNEFSPKIAQKTHPVEDYSSPGRLSSDKASPEILEIEPSPTITKLSGEKIIFKEPVQKLEEKLNLSIENQKYIEEKSSRKESIKDDISSPKGDNSDIPSPREISFHKENRDDEDILSSAGEIEENYFRKYEEKKASENEEILAKLNEKLKANDFLKEELQKKGFQPNKLLAENHAILIEESDDSFQNSKIDTSTQNQNNENIIDIQIPPPIENSPNKSLDKSSEKSDFVECVVDLMDDTLRLNKPESEEEKEEVDEMGIEIKGNKAPLATKPFYKITHIKVPKHGKGFSITLKKSNQSDKVKSSKHRPSFDENFDTDRFLSTSEFLEDDEEDEEGRKKYKKSKYTPSFYTDDVPRRSLREKKEPPKGYDPSALGEDYGFTFVDFKQYKYQKLRVYLSFKSLLMMNIHAHLSKLEVIGIIGGRAISDEEVIIDEALPCQNISESSNTHSVEMDPTSQVESQEKIEKMGLSTLGWYHSHPTFKTTPSQIDQTTHTNHQVHYKDHAYIGVIIGPYSVEKGASKTKGDVFVFHVNNNQTYKLLFKMQPSTYLLQSDVDEMKNLLNQYKSSKKGIKFNDNWKKTITYKTKLLSCVQALLEDNLEMLNYKDETASTPIVSQTNSYSTSENKKSHVSLDSEDCIKNFLGLFNELLE